MNPPGGLVSWWRAEGTADDWYSGHNNGVAYNLTNPYPAGKVGEAFGFNGNNAVVWVADSPDLRFTTLQMTVEAWIRPTSYAAQAILSKWDMIEHTNRSYNFYLDYYGHVNFTVSADGSGSQGSCGLVTGASTVTYGSWTHVAATYNGVNLKVYFNGSLDNTVSWSGGMHAGNDALGIGAVVGGGTQGLAGGAPFHGDIDEASVYSACLADSDILAIYNAGSLGKCVAGPAECAKPDPSQVSWWRAETDATDYEGLNNGIGTSLAFAPGKVNQAFVFNGSSANVWVADSPSLHVTDALTLEAWVNPAATNAGQAILSKWDMWDGLYQKSYNFYLDNDGHVCLTLSGTGDGTDATIVQSAAPVTPGGWTHVAGTFGGYTMTVYINGNQQGSANWYSSIKQGTNALGIGAVVGGGTLGGQVGGPFYGSIDEASVYPQCLSASSILAIYEASAQGKCQLPRIITQPQTQATAPGGNVTFSVAAAGTLAMTYQWLFNSTPLAGDIGSALTIAGAQAANDGQYAVVVSNSEGSVTSLTACLTVLVPGTPAVWGDNSSEACAPQPGLTNAAAIAVGGQHALAAGDDGKVRAWGANGSGQATVPPGLSNVIAVAAGASHSLALTSDGTVHAWGDNTYLQAAVPTGLSGVTAIAAAANQCLALKADGTVVSWGQTYAAVPSGLANVTAIAAGETFSLALIGNGTVVAWGQNGSGQTNVPYGLANVVAIAAGGSHALALKKDGSITAWGANGSGQATVPAGPNNFIAVAAGSLHSLARRNDATTVAWGDNTYGQCNAQVPNVLVKLIAAGANHSTVAAFSPLVQYPINVTSDLLLVYNPNTVDGAGVFAYYMANRPMVTGANVLALTNCPATFSIKRTNYNTAILAPLTSWLSANPTKRPQYMVMFVDVPVRINGWTNEGYLQYWVSNADNSVSYDIYTNSVGIPPFITHINMRDPNTASAAPCMSYINKLQSFGATYSPGKLFISAAAGGYAGTTYVLDNGRHGITDTNDPNFYNASNYLINAYNSLVQTSGVSPSSIYYTNGPPLDEYTLTFTNGTYTWIPNNGVHITSAWNVAGYASWGAHSALGNLYPYPGPPYPANPVPVAWGGASGWWLIDTFESYNGMPGAGQGNYWEWFFSAAFGSTNYENTPVGAMTSTDEPDTVVVPYPYFNLWVAGKNFAICAWNARQTRHFQAVGDPFVTR